MRGEICEERHHVWKAVMDRGQKHYREREYRR